MRWLAAIAVAALALSVGSGCVYNQDIQGTPISMEALPTLEAGRTTEQELLLALGPPVKIGWDRGETRFLYTFSIEELRQLYVTYQGFRIFSGEMTDRTSRAAFFDFSARGKLLRWGFVTEDAEE